MTLVLSESEVGRLLSMGDVVRAVEECFSQTPRGAVNTPRTRTSVPGAVLNVMHASLPYLGRAGVKCYLSSRKGVRFVFVLFSLEDAEPLALMGADVLGRFRTGAASAVATKHLSRMASARFALAGSGKQALTQAVAMKEVVKLESVKAWSPNRAHLEEFIDRLASSGIEAAAASSISDAFASADIATTITKSSVPFLGKDDVVNLSHLNLCGSNHPANAEATPQAIGEFGTLATDDIDQAKYEAGDLIRAAEAGSISWERVVQLGEFVSGRAKPDRKTLFKSNGVAIEDVAVASLVYEKARQSSESSGTFVEIGKER